LILNLEGAQADGVLRAFLPNEGLVRVVARSNEAAL
jgi:hypothetical protein